MVVTGSLRTLCALVVTFACVAAVEDKVNGECQQQAEVNVAYSAQHRLLQGMKMRERVATNLRKCPGRKCPGTLRHCIQP
jgi:hypothetical protein